MQECDLIVGVVAAQAGFVTPSEVLSAAAASIERWLAQAL